MKEPFDPKTLEPKDGDFASFIDQLNRESIQELKALRVTDEQMKAEVQAQVEAGTDLFQDSAKQAPVIRDPQEAFRDDRPRSQRPVARKKVSAKYYPLFLVVFSFVLFAYGGATSQEDLVITAFSCFSFAIIMAIIIDKRNKRR